LVLKQLKKNDSDILAIPLATPQPLVTADDIPLYSLPVLSLSKGLPYEALAK
jgi:hypothetical protein